MSSLHYICDMTFLTTPPFYSNPRQHGLVPTTLVMAHSPAIATLENNPFAGHKHLVNPKLDMCLVLAGKED